MHGPIQASNARRRLPPEKVAAVAMGLVSAAITVTWASLGMTSTSATVRDPWSHTELGSTATQYTATVPSHGVVMLKVFGS
jgi:hypothetical protein